MRIIAIVDIFGTFTHIPKKTLLLQGSVLESIIDIFISDAPVAQWIEQWFPVPCAGVRFPSGVLPGTYVQFRCVVSQELSESGTVKNRMRQ